MKFPPFSTLRDESPARLHLDVQPSLHGAHLHVLVQVAVHVALGCGQLQLRRRRRRKRTLHKTLVTADCRSTAGGSTEPSPQSGRWSPGTPSPGI